MTEVYAHRGLHVAERENTVAAFRAARALGVDGVELDVRRSADGVLVVHHDASARGRSIARTPSGDLGRDVATLAAALDACAGMALNVEIKVARARTGAPDGPGALAREVVAALDAVREGVVVSCFDLATCRAVRAAAPTMRVGWLVGARTPIGPALEVAREAGLAALHPNHRAVGPAIAARARDLGLELNVWTVNRARDIAAMVALGVTSVITDDPATALALARGGPEVTPAVMP